MNMTEGFSSFKAKLHYWWQYTKNCFRIQNPFILHARRLTKISEKAIQSANNSQRRFIFKEYFHTWLPSVLGVYFTAQNYHKTVQTLALSGFGLNAFHIVRSQLESVLIFFYFTEPHDDFVEIDNRVSHYIDWLVAKMYANMTKSSDFPVVQAISNYDQFIQQVEENYQELEKKYYGREKELNILKKPSSFLKNKPAIADRHGFKSLYDHIQAECSASIHIADLSDRIEELVTDDYHEYNLNALIDEGRWAMSLSNVLQLFLTRQLAKFFHIEDTIVPLLKDVM